MSIKKPVISDIIPVKNNHLVIREEVDPNTGAKVTYVVGIMQRAESRNQNGRSYPRKLLQREATRYMQEEIQESRAFGELDHPDSPVVNLKNASHTIEKLWWEGDDLMGKVEILDTPSGRIVESILRAGKTLGISSRGLGSVKEQAGGVEVQEDFELVCFDFVSNPSTHGAFMRPMNEGVDTNLEVNKYAGVNAVISDILRGE